MTEAERALVQLSAALAAGNADALAHAIDRAAMLAPAQAEEAILQSYLFVGYPAALQALATWRARTGLPAPPGAADDAREWRTRGERVCATVYGGQYERLRENIVALHPDVEEWMLTEGYGKVLGRPGLPLRVRELCIIALLAAQHAPAQLYSHVRGAVNAGASAADVDDAIETAARVLPADRVAALRETWNRVRSRRPGS